MKCMFCSGEIFSAHQVCRLDIKVDGENMFLGSLSGDTAADIYDSEKPYGPYRCQGCGAEYDVLRDGEIPTSGPIPGWNDRISSIAPTQNGVISEENEG